MAAVGGGLRVVSDGRAEAEHEGDRREDGEESSLHGSFHGWLALSVQVQIWTWVPAPPKPVSSRHLPEFGFRSSPSDCGTQVCAPVPLQWYRSTVVPLAVPAASTSRHLPRTVRVSLLLTVQCCALVPLQV